MGRITLHEFPVVLETIQHLDRILSKVQPKPSFSIAELLLSDDEDSARRINDADVAQPLCTAIQIALVDLFAQWNITPEVSVGHSSGEIGAAYAAGLISAPEAILAAFCRGRAVSEHSSSGSMLAVGIGAHEVEKYLSPYDVKDICIACENSPSSVTLSGREGPISDLREKLTSEKIFARELPTGRAYHSPHMASVGIAYDGMLAEAINGISEDDLLWRRSRSYMISSVTGQVVDSCAESLKPGYWSDNLRNRVLFNTAVQQLGTNTEFDGLTHLIEVGPHSALAGPFKQICQDNKSLGGRVTYLSSLKRNENDTDRLLGVAGSLFVAGYGVDLEEVNLSNESGIMSEARKNKTKHLIVDLPPYQWNYEKRYWTEPRASAEQRARAYPRHDLLGSRISGLSQKAASWRNVLRQRDVPWLKDHNLGGTAIFPAAGHLSMAIEALQQVCETAGKPFEGVKLRDVDIRTALVVPDDDDGVEVLLNLQVPTEPTSDWYNFSVESPGADGEWTIHCNGRISAIGSRKDTQTSDKTPVDEAALTQRVSGQRWYNAFHRVGFNYGKTFQQLRHARTARTLHHAAGDVTVRQTYPEEMQGESRYLMHPTSIDACLQLIIISINSGKHKEMSCGVVPTRLEEVILFPAKVDPDSCVGHAVAWTDVFEGRRFNTHVQLSGGENDLLLDIKNLTCTAYEAALPAVSGKVNGTEAKGPEPFSIMSWKPDIEALRDEDLNVLWPDNPSEMEKIKRCIDLIGHNRTLSKVFVVASDCVATTQALVHSILETLPESTTISVAIPTDDDKKATAVTSQLAQARVQVNTWVADPENWEIASAGTHDLVVVDSHVKGPPSPEHFLQLAGEDGWLIYPSSESTTSSCASFSLPLGEHALLHKAISSAQQIDASPNPNEVTVLSATSDRSLCNYGAALARLRSQIDVQEKCLSEFTQGQDSHILVDDLSGAVSASMLENEADYETIKQLLISGVPMVWLTRGLRQGRPVGQSGADGIAEGLLRVIRSEQAAAKITLLDVDSDEESASVCRAIVHTLRSTATKDSGCDTEFWLHRGIMHISRVCPRDSLNRDLSQRQPQKIPLSGLLKLVDKTEDGEFVFESEAREELSTLGDEEVEIQVLASGWPSFSAGSRMLVAGDIVRVGKSVAETNVGKRAVAFTYDTLRTILPTSAYSVVSEVCQRLAPESLVHTLIPLCPLVSLCVSSAKLEKGDAVISLPGSEQSTEVLTKLANVMGWRLSIVSDADDTSTVNALISSQRDLTVSRTVTIIAHDFDTHLTQEVWRHIPPSCRLLVLNEKPFEAALDPLPFSRGASFIPSSMRYLRESARAASSLLTASLNFIAAHPSFRIEPSDTATHFVDIEDARNRSKNQSKEPSSSDVVVRYRPENSRIWTVPKSKQLRLSPDATYLLVGCLGGLGRSLTRWMMDRGAKHFTFISRSGTDKPEAARLVADIELSGASTQVVRADASNEDDVTRTVSSIQAERPIRGVVHAAMVLKVRTSVQPIR